MSDLRSRSHDDVTVIILNSTAMVVHFHRIVTVYHCLPSTLAPYSDGCSVEETCSCHSHDRSVILSSLRLTAFTVRKVNTMFTRRRKSRQTLWRQLCLLSACERRFRIMHVDSGIIHCRVMEILSFAISEWVMGLWYFITILRYLHSRATALHPNKQNPN